MKRSGLSLLLLGSLFTACKVIPVDPFVAAQSSLKAGDLLGTLLYLDQVAPSHPRFTDARSIAQAVERRMRTAQKLLSQGMALRAEWRDEEAIAKFEQALSVWGRVSSARELILATEHRMSALQPSASGDAGGEDIGVAETSPIGFPMTGAGKVGEQEAKAGARVDPLEPITTPGAPPDIAARLRVALDLLDRGQLERALDLLEGMHAELPNQPRVARSLVRVLNQRALLHYGQGDLELALSDWTRVLRLDAGHDQARGFLLAAQAELKSLQD